MPKQRLQVLKVPAEMLKQRLQVLKILSQA
jgi:hypothetical protein